MAALIKFITAIVFFIIPSSVLLAQESTMDSSAENISTASQETLFLISDSLQSINIRVRPSTASTVIGSVESGEAVRSLESPELTLSKVGIQNEWIQVHTQSGIEGFTAAWLFKLYEDTPTPVMEDTFDLNQTSSESLKPVFLTPKSDGIRIRRSPGNGTVLTFVSFGEILEVIEPLNDTAISKLGEPDTWVQVKGEDGIAGYTGAWLYDIYDGEAPLWSSSSEPVTRNRPFDLTSMLTISMPGQSFNLPGTAQDDIGSSLNNPWFNSSGRQINISPLFDTITALGLSEIQTANQEPLQESMVDDFPQVRIYDTPTAISSNVVPITINLEAGIDITSAELSVNDYRLATFTGEPPFTYDLDISAFEPGDYDLAFTVVNYEGVISADNFPFEVFIPQTATSLGGATNTVVSPQPPEDMPVVSRLEMQTNQEAMSRFALIEGKYQPFNLIFSVGEGLKLVKLLETPVQQASLGAILTQPFNIIPEPIKVFLTQPRPVESTIIILLMTALMLPQGLITLYWMTYTWNKPEVADQYRSPKTYVEPQHGFTAILPARHEADVIKDTIYAVDRINYPDHLKEILIMVRDEDDDATIAKAKEAIQEIGKDSIKLITFTTGPKNKPNGLNRGLKAATKEVICVFDAEDEPHPDLYNVVNTVMIRDQADVVQSGVQLMNFRSTWFSALNCLEYFFWFKSGLHCFTQRFKVTPLGGNTVFFKKEWLDKLGGWDESCLTEDGDVGIRLTALGAKIQIVYDEKHATQEETPDTVDSFIKQRTRWCQGFYQIFFKGDWAKLPTLGQKLIALHILLNSLFQAATLFFIPVGLYIALTQRIPVPVALLSYIPIYILLLQMITNLIGIREFTRAYGLKLPFLFTLKMMVVYYPYQLLLTIAAARAVYRMVGQKQSWEKTAHSNLHRQQNTVRV